VKDMTEGILLGKTKTVCEKTLKVIDAQVIEKGGWIILRKLCPDHGVSEVRHIFDMPLLYEKMKQIFCKEQVDNFYPHDLILYITSKCNLLCPVCYSSAGENGAQDLSLKQAMEMVCRYQGGAVHISGGEPTLREDLFDLLTHIKEKGFFTGLFTNGLRLEDENYVKKLKEAKLDLVILSFDSLRESDLVRLRGRPLLESKLKAFSHIKKEGIGVYLFSAVVAGINDDQIGPLIEFAKENIDSVDIVNFNPVWRVGRYDDFTRIPASKIYQRMEENGFLFDEFMLCTEFSHLCFEILSKLLGKKWRRQPPCAQRLYLFKLEDKIIKLTDLLDLPYLNKRLNDIHSKVKSSPKFISWGLLICCFPFGYFIKGATKNETLRKLTFFFARNLFAWKRKKRWLSSRLLSVMIGAFHSPEDADFQFLRKCTLYCNSEQGDFIQCACLRQILSETNNRSICELVREF